MENEHGPRALADDEVALPMAGLAATFNGLRTIMDRRSILDGVARGSGVTRATAFVAPCQITPQGLCLLPLGQVFTASRRRSLSVAQAA